MAISKQETSWNVANSAPVSPSRQFHRSFKTGSKTHGLSLVVAQYSILAALIGTMTWLAFKTSNRRAFDRTCGELSYPLYLYHQNVIIVALSLTTGYSYPVFVTGVAMSLIVSYGLMRLVDPAVNRVRDIVRGRRLQPARSYAAHDSTVQWPAV